MIKILLVGASGYGAVYLHFLFKKCKETDYRIAGIVDPYVEKSPFYDILKNQGIPFYDRMEDFYESRKADLAVIASPIHFHALQTEIALKNGSNVLCEKPVCAGPEDIEKMASFKEKYEGFVAVGYQWSFSQAILDLKKDILSGLFGKAEYLKPLVSWPRSHAYFNRNNWAGKIKTEDGRYILDSVANNATAHYLHNMFYALGKTLQESVLPKIEHCVLGAANPIENFDTITVQATGEDGTKFYFAAAHPVSTTKGPVFEYKFENGIVTYNPQERQEIIAVFKDGSKKVYGNPGDSDHNKLILCMEKTKNKKLELPSTVETALPHARFIYNLYRSYPVNRFKDNLIKTVEIRNAPVTIVEGLDKTLDACYEDMRMLSEEYFKR
jgi:predicted dehydrogenase